MKSLNRVTLMGRLGQNPVLKTAKNGKPYTRLSVATTKAWKTDENSWEERTEWHSIFVWGHLAERCTKSCRSGSLVYVEGALSHWTGGDQAGSFKVAIQATDVLWLHSAENVDNSDGPRNHNAVAHPE